MANKSVRIQTTPGGNDKYVTVKLENDVDFYEVLSLKISQNDIYGTFNSDYGVIVGRVIANGGVGIPNAKISVFIPITDDDKTNAAIATIYPYTSPRDKDLDGVRYNLLPRVAVNNPFIIAGEYAPAVPVGTFPTKEEITTNDSFLEVYQKYYKFTTVSNQSGDYMIFGVPIGIQTVHMSVDITDIGKYSMTPGTMITNLGYSPQLFTDNGTKVKFSTDLDTLPNVETQEIAVNVRPFWGDETTFEIGITRQDFKIRATLVTTVTIFGNAFTDAQSGTWGRGGQTIKQLYAMNGDDTNIAIGVKRLGELHETIMYVPNTVDESVINSNTLDPVADFKELTKSEYTRYISQLGQFIYVIQCNRKKIITDENGNDQPVTNDDPRGVYTEFVATIVFTYSDTTILPIDRTNEYDGHVADGRRLRLKVPARPVLETHAGSDGGISTPYFHESGHETLNDAWRIQNQKFGFNKYYSVARFHGIANSDGDSNEGEVNRPTRSYSSGSILPHNDPDSIALQYPSNVTDPADGSDIFAVEWMNFSLYFPQYTFFGGRFNDAGRGKLLNADNRTIDGSVDNTQEIVGTLVNTVHIARSDLNSTEFIEVPKSDILKIINNGFDTTSSPLGFRNGVDGPYATDPLTGTDYKSNSSTPGSPGTYFYKGLGTDADIFKFIRDNSIV